ncbi:uncharacterized protein LOC119198156 isoform X2 [Pungitius pungitius]|uniref:uncharacterized protein LOC119198156 isoform X2 n=1 Tax=Pungitius pungitius TaxID=134920 RepID=UPI002E116A9A
MPKVSTPFPHSAVTGWGLFPTNAARLRPLGARVEAPPPLSRRNLPTWRRASNGSCARGRFWMKILFCTRGNLRKKTSPFPRFTRHSFPPRSAVENDIAALIKEALSRSTPAPMHATEEAFSDNLADGLQPIQTRKLRARVKTRSSASQSCEEDPPASSPRVAPRRGGPCPSRSSPGRLPSPPSARERQLNNDWHYHFQVPWRTLPTALRSKLDNQQRPAAKERREMIRIVAAEILHVCKNPSKRHLEEVARKMVLAYPKSFTDIIEDEVVGSGYDSLTKQLQYRVDNCKRKTMWGKQRRPAGGGGGGGGVARKRKRRRNSYGCVQQERWPSRVDAQKKRGLREMFLRGEADTERVGQWMSDTFACQRSDIRSGKDARALRDEWPYLFSLGGVKAHFEQLTGVGIDGAFEDAMGKKLARVDDFFRWSGGAPAGRGGACGAVMALLSHFKEDLGRMFHASEETDGARTERLPATPCIVACGASPCSAAAFVVAVDREVILEDLASFTDALIAMFVCYFVFDLPYPADVAATMEFLQRCIFKINPDKGSKVEVRENRRNNAVNPKVLTLITRISDFEWNA